MWTPDSSVGDADHVDFRRLFASLPTAFLVMTNDLVIVEANAAYTALTGRSRAELVGRYVFEAFPPPADALDADGRNPIEISFLRARDTGQIDVLPLQKYDISDSDAGPLGERYWSLISAPVLDDDGSTILVLQRTEDVTEYVRERADRLAGGVTDDEWQRRLGVVEADLFVRMQQLQTARDAELAAVVALRQSEERVRAILDTAADAVVTIDRQGAVDSMNRSAELMFGYPADDVVGRNVAMLMPEPYRSEHDGYLAHYRHTGEKRIIGIGREAVGQRSDGSTFPIELAISEVGLDSGLFTGIVRDITVRKTLEGQLAHQSVHDPLTGLANRTLMLDRLEHAVLRLNRHPGVVAVFFVDLDRFKSVNDTLGHAAGDEPLVTTAHRLRASVRHEDLVARFGGDEFVVLCEDLRSLEEAEVIASRMLELLNTPVSIHGHDVQPAASVGFVTDTGTRSAAELLREADSAMYRAKKSGGGLVHAAG